MNDAATTCEHVRPELSAYIDGELPAGETARVELHLRECGECRAEEAALRRLAAELAALPRMRVPRDLAANIRDNGGPVRSEPGESLAVRDLNRRARRYLVFAQVMASAALVVLCVTVAWRLMDSWRETAVSTLAVRSDFESPVDRRIAAETAPASPSGGVSREARRRVGGDRDRREGRGLAAAPPPAADEPSDRVASLANEPAAQPAEATVIAGAPLALGYEPPEPTVNVVVTAQTMEQFNNAISIVQNAAPEAVRHQDELTAGQLFADDEQMSASSHAVGRGMFLAFARQQPAPAELELQVPPEQVWPLINSLEQNAPRQLAVEMNFRGDDAVRLQNAPATLGLPVEAGEAIREDLKSALSEDQAAEAARRIARDSEGTEAARAVERDKEKDEAPGEDSYGAARTRQTRTGETADRAGARSDEGATRERANADETRKRAEAAAEPERHPGGSGGGRAQAAGAADVGRSAATDANVPAKSASAEGETAGRSAGYRFGVPPTTMPYDSAPKQVTFRVRVVPPPPPASQPQTTQPSQ